MHILMLMSLTYLKILFLLHFGAHSLPKLHLFNPALVQQKCLLIITWTMELFGGVTILYMNISLFLKNFHIHFVNCWFQVLNFLSSKIILLTRCVVYLNILLSYCFLLTKIILLSTSLDIPFDYCLQNIIHVQVFLFE